MDKPMPQDSQEESAEASKDPMQLLQAGGEMLSQLAQIVQSAPQASPGMKQKMSQIMKLYSDMSEEAMGGEAEPMAENEGQVPIQQGVGGMPMGPATKN